MRLLYLTLCLSACTVTEPPRACDTEETAVALAKCTKRCAMDWSTDATERDAYSAESKRAWAAVEQAVANRNEAQRVLDACTRSTTR